MANNVRKKNKISKNKKKSWKNIDIEDVEEFLEDERLQERTGGLVAEKTDEQLFVVDKREDLTEDDKQSENKETLKRKRRREPKPLKCHANLVPDPKIKPSRIKHNERFDKLDRRHKNVVKKIQSGKLTYTQIKAQQQRKTALDERHVRRKSKRQLPTADYDLWSEEGPDNKEDSHYMVTTKKRRVNVPKHYLEKPSEVPALEVPHPGASYNPAYDDHQELLRKAHNVEVKKVKEENRIYNALDAKFTATDWNSIEKNWLNEMSAGLEVEDGEVEEAFTAEDLDKLSVNPPVRRDDIKSEKQRKKEQGKKKEEKIKSKETAKKQRERDIFRLKTIKKEIKQEEKRKKERAQKRANKKASGNLETRKLGKLKYEEQLLELKLSDELEGSLRLLKPEGNLFEDRFKSLQKRNLIEPRLRAKKQKHYTPKSFEKKSHRNVPEVKLL